MVILLFGPPGSGKGTQSPLITKLLGIPSISTGEMLRAEVEAETSIGKTVAEVLSAGRLVTDELVNEMLVKRLAQPDCRDGFLLDGYPRTVRQAAFVDEHLARRGFPPPTVIHLATPKSVLIERISSRRQCPQCGTIYNLLFKPPKRHGVCDLDGTPLVRRKDDSVDVVRERLESYERLTKPVLEHYKNGDFHPVRADRPPAEIVRDIRAILEPYLVILALRRIS